MARPNVSEERRAQILAAAAHVFVREGLERARMEDIAHEAGLSVGGVYWYFKGKEAVVQALLQAMFDADLQGLRAVLAAEGSVHARLTAYVGASLAASAAQSPLSNELYSLATRNAAARTHLLAYLGEFQRLIAGLIQQGIDRGELRAVDSMAAALTLIAVYEGFTELAMIGLPETGHAATLLAMLELILAGMSSAPAPVMIPASAPPVRSGGKWQQAVRSP